MGLQKSLSLLARVPRNKCEQFEQECARAGIPIGWNETRRSPLVQHAYYAQGRENLDAVNVKRIKAGLWLITAEENERKITWKRESIHQYDCAGDFFLIVNGKPSWNVKTDINDNDISDYEEAGRIAESLGLEWGGRWRNKDLVHVQFTDGLTMKELRAGIRPREDIF